MTLADYMALLKEVRGLEMVRAVITANCLQDEWRYAVAAMDDRLNWDRYVLAQAPAEMIAAAEDRLYAERVAEVLRQPVPAPSLEPETPEPELAGDAPTRPTIH